MIQALPFLVKHVDAQELRLGADTSSVTGAVAAVSGIKAKTKLGGLLRHPCVKTTGRDLTWTVYCVDRGSVCMPSCFMNGENLPLLACVCICTQPLHVFQAGSTSRG